VAYEIVVVGTASEGKKKTRVASHVNGSIPFSNPKTTISMVTSAMITSV